MLKLQAQLTGLNPTKKGGWILTLFDGRDMFKVYAKDAGGLELNKSYTLDVSQMNDKAGRLPLLGLRNSAAN